MAGEARGEIVTCPTHMPQNGGGCGRVCQPTPGGAADLHGRALPALVPSVKGGGHLKL